MDLFLFVARWLALIGTAWLWNWGLLFVLYTLDTWADKRASLRAERRSEHHRAEIHVLAHQWVNHFYAERRIFMAEVAKVVNEPNL